MSTFFNKNSKKLNYTNINNILKKIHNYNYVLLGESTHGTSEFYNIRLAITILLVSKYNFNTILLEMEWSLGYQLNRFIHSKLDITADQLLIQLFKYFPIWMSCNKYIEHLILFLKEWNNINEKKVYIYGIDCQNIDIAQANLCDEPTLNCPIVRSIINNYYKMVHSNNYWNMRDQFWFYVLHEIKNYRSSTFILWAHNSHVGDSSANIRSSDHINIGYLIEQTYDAYIIGFSTNQGEVMASTHWGKRGTIMKLNPGIKNSYENIFSQICMNKKTNRIIYVCDKKKNILKYFRYIGVIYDKHNERRAHYIKTNINKEFDIIIFINISNAIEPCKLSIKNSSFNVNSFVNNAKYILDI